MDWNLLTGTGRSRHKGSRQVFKMLILEEMFKNIFLVFNANPTPATLGYRRILYMVKIVSNVIKEQEINEQNIKFAFIWENLLLSTGSRVMSWLIR